MSAHSDRRSVPKRKSLVGKVLKVVVGLTVIVALALTVLFFAHRPTFDKVAAVGSGATRGLIVYFWQDVSHELVKRAQLPADEATAAHATVDRLASALKTHRGDAHASGLEQVADRFITQLDAGKTAAADVRPLLADASTALDGLPGAGSATSGG